MMNETNSSTWIATPCKQPQRPVARKSPNIWFLLRASVVVVLTAGLLLELVVVHLFADDSSPADGVLAQLQNIPAATLSDAVDQVIGRRGFMSYDMRPISLEKRMAGRAKTVLFGPSGEKTKEKNRGPLYGIQVIDESGPGDIMVVVTGDLNITGLGGLMATTASVRGMSGVVVDGAVRDVDEIRNLGFSVFCRSISPATMLGRSTSIARDVPVNCGGVTVASGDYIVGDRDGVVCIPAGQIDAVIERALEMEAAEKKMVPKIYEIKSLQKVVEMFKRI
jgi:4-hydroxy-4-methyl-2-oxoglutarate aldolase